MSTLSALPTDSPRRYRRIATEEAWITPHLLAQYKRLLDDTSFNDPGFRNLWGYLSRNPEKRATDMVQRLLDLGPQRIADMDAAGVDLQLLLLTSPGLQVFDAGTGRALAAESNDILAEAIARHPTRFAGLAAVAPQESVSAARELERAMGPLGLKGLVINSHINGEYLDDPKFWPLLEAAEALDAPLYLHPNTPPADMIAPFLKRHMESAVYGFACETGLHVLRMIFAGVFDRFPRLRVVLGHLGEGLPYFLYRIDYMHGGIARSNRTPDVQPLRRSPSEVLRQNFYYTTSGMAWAPAMQYVHALMGPDRILYAMDYPYQYVPEEIATLEGLPFSDQDMKRLFETNAVDLFKL